MNLLLSDCTQVNHELSVPAVSTMLLACTAFVTAAVSGLILQKQQTLATMQQLRGLATGITILVYWVQESQRVSWVCTVLTAVTAGISLLIQLRGPPT